MRERIRGQTSDTRGENAGDDEWYHVVEAAMSHCIPEKEVKRLKHFYHSSRKVDKPMSWSMQLMSRDFADSLVEQFNTLYYQLYLGRYPWDHFKISTNMSLKLDSTQQLPKENCQQRREWW